MPYSRKPLICKIDHLPRVLKMILAHQLLYATKPRDDDWLKKKWSWRELFSTIYNHKVFTCVASKSKSQSLIGRNYPYCCIMGIMWLRQLQELFHIWFALKVEIYFLADRILSSFHWNSAAFTLFLVSHVRSFKAGLIGLCRWLSALHIEDQLAHLSSLRCSSWECVHESTRQSCDMISVKLSQYVASTPKLKQAN